MKTCKESGKADMKLPNDTFRCMGSGCPVSLREACERYIQRNPIEHEHGIYPWVYTLNLVRCSDHCDFFIKAKI